MASQVMKIDGEIIDVNSFDNESWENFKKNYSIGDIKMICCNSNAIPKTSINFTKFFAHQHDICKTNPETIWHKTTKKIILNSLINLGYTAKEEVIGGDWRADVLVESNSRRIAFEIQHSPQTLTTYLERTNRYKDNNIEVFWILYEPRYKTIKKAISKKIMHDLNSKFTKKEIIAILHNGLFPILKELPVFYIDDQNFRVKNVGLFDHSVIEFLDSIFQNKLVLEKKWIIRDEK